MATLILAPLLVGIALATIAMFADALFKSQRYVSALLPQRTRSVWYGLDMDEAVPSARPPLTLAPPVNAHPSMLSGTRTDRPSRLQRQR
jgi:hypothetical protein